jgi:hypothetical protein
LIFDEVTEAKKILLNKDLEYFDLGKMTILAKYFYYIGKNTREVKSEIIDFCNSQHRIKYDEGDEDVILKAIKNSKKYKIRSPKTCVITQAELDEIGTIGDFKTERVFFVMICLSKYFMETNTAKNPKEQIEDNLIFWKTTAELFRTARYSENFFNRNMILGVIERMGYIETRPNRERTKNHIRIKTYYKNSEPVIFFDNPEFVYKLYKAYKDKKIMRCEVCGNSTVKNSNRQSMCEKCWKENRVEINHKYYENKKLRPLENAIKPL